MIAKDERSMRYSKQRELIYNYLCSTYEHPSAEKIYSDLKVKMPNLSLGTVYRNLKVLQELGKIKTVPTNDDVEHYDADCSKHIHFICEDCNEIIDIKNVDYDNLIKSLNLDDSFKLSKINLSIVGKCKNCK